MKKYFIPKIWYLFIGSFIVILINSCKEIGPPIDLTETVYETYIETPEAPQNKVVVIEDFTGAACVNCPLAHEAITEIISLHPGQIAAIAEYNYFADPLNIDEILVTQPAYDIDNNILGPINSWPASFVDRVDFDDDNLLAEVPDNLLPYTEQQLLLTPPCNIYLDKLFDDISRNLSLTLTIKYTEDITVPNNLSVVIAENGIIAAQITPTGEIPDYIHNHVMRAMLTFYSGDALPETNVAGRVYVFNYTYLLPAEWNAANMDIIAFVHNFDGDNKEILQGAIVEIY